GLNRFGVPNLDLPEKLRHREELVTLDAFANVNAVDAELRELSDHLGTRGIVASERDAVLKDVAPNDVNAQRRSVPQMLVHQIVELFELLRHHWMPGGIRPGEASEARKALQNGERSGRRGRPCRDCRRCCW